MKFRSPILKIAEREFYRITDRKTLFLLSVILPVFIFTFFALIYKNEIVRDLPVGILDFDNSNTSKLITRYIEASSYLKIGGYYNNIEEIKAGIRSGKLQGAICFPYNMETDIKIGKPVAITVFKNTVNLVVGNLILKDASTIIKTVSGGVLLKKLKSKSMHSDKAYNIVNPIKIETKSLYNAHYSYLNYLVPGLLACLFQMVIMLSGVLIISSEFVHKTFHELVELSNKNVFAIVIGKSLPHIIFHLITTIAIIGVIFPIFNIHIAGSTIGLLVLFLFFIMASFFPAFMISCLFHDQLFATELALILNTPAFLFSGFTFPLPSMPFLHNIFADIIPFTHFLYAYLMIYQMGTPFSYIFNYLLILSVFIVVSLIVIIISLKKQMKNLKPIKTAA
ncbi:MAG: ABC transporter permease [bacterium]